jgi:hypothetical protein
MAYDLDHPSPAVKSFARWLQDKKNVPVTELEAPRGCAPTRTRRPIRPSGLEARPGLMGG